MRQIAIVVAPILYAQCIGCHHAVADAVPPPACDDATNPLFGSCIDTFLAGCFEPDRSGTCTDSAGVIQWSDGSTYVQPGQHGSELPGFYRPGETSPCVGLATNSTGSTLSKGTASIRYAPRAENATITCPNGSTFTAGAAQITTFNVCRGISCPPTGT